MRKIKILKLLTVITNILTIVCLILVLTLKTQFFYSLYWALIPLLLMFVMLLIREIDKGNIDTDINKSKSIKKAYNDSTAIAIVFYGMVYLIILFFEQLSSKVYNNIYVIIGFFTLTLLYELFLSLSVYNASKETSKILNKKK